MKSKEKVVVIGANGLIGKAFIEAYKNKYNIMRYLWKK